MISIEELKKKKIAVLMGGWSNEREISIKSGTNIYNALKKSGCNVISIDVDNNIVEILKREKIDLAYIALHGPFGEDGGIQAILEMLRIPYTGSDVLASAIGMNKLMCKRVAMSVGVKTSPFLEIMDYKNDRQRIAEKLGFPVVVKPTSEGSSIGVFIVNDENELEKIFDKLSKEYKSCFVEKYIRGKEVTVGVLGTAEEDIALPILELVSKNEFYDFEAKYTKGLTEFILPANLDEDTTKSIQELALLMHKTIGCKGATRSDFIIDENNDAFFLEINTSPGMTDTSDVPAEAKCKGIEIEELVLKIALSAFAK